jgi:hypothetical protein
MRFSALCWLIAFVNSLVLCSCKDSTDEKRMFTKMNPEQTGIQFVNTNKEDEQGNILSYEYFYNGGGVAVGDINNDGLTDIYFSANQEENRLYLNKGNFKFQDITSTAGVGAKSGWRTGVTMADVNGDGWLDIYVCRSGNEHPLMRQNSLFINNHDLTFTDKAADFGLNDDSYSTQAAFFDFDRDGDLDMFLLNHSRLAISNSYDVTRRYKTDGGRYVANKFFKNENGKFVDVSAEVGIFGSPANYGLGIATADINNDGWIDVYATSDYTEKDKVFLNIQGNHFKDCSDSLFSHMSQFSMGVDIGDINNDSYDDIITLDMLPESNHRQKEFYWPDKYDVYQAMVRNGLHHQFMRNMLQVNNGDGTFSEAGQLAGISNTDWSWASLFADLDNDGLLDIFITNGFKRNFTSNDFLRYKADLSLKAQHGEANVGLNDILQKMPENKVHDYIFKNEGDLKFSDVSKDWGVAEENLSNGAAYADFDNDGDLDMVVNNIDEVAWIYRNDANEFYHNNFIKTKLVGNEKNSFAFGAAVTIFSDTLVAKRSLNTTRGFQSSVDPVLVFGIGQRKKIDSIVVQWPSGNIQTLRNPEINQVVVIKEQSGNRLANKLVKPLLTSTGNQIPFSHRENIFVDFKVQALLPRMYSTQGPALAKGDVNGDQKEDIFVGGAKGFPSEIFVQLKNGQFAKSSGIHLPTDSEIVDALFFDKDNDGDCDLYLVTGGYEFSKDDPALKDYLFENDGKGNFKIRSLPDMLSSGSCVRASDIDGDHDIDLFVGGRIIPGRYPETPESYLLINDGKGNFSVQTENVAPALNNIGMVTDAAWTNVNEDKLIDLIVVGEWMNPRVFVNQNGKLVEDKNLFTENDQGWWNCILSDDFDGDGDMDFVAGNFGLNNQFKPSNDRPINMLFADFDKNGSVDPLISYFIQDKSYPWATRDELVDQLPSFKKRFLQYSAYTDVTVDNILSEDERADAKKLSASTFATTYFENTGGKFKSHSLPTVAQLSPVFSICALDVDNDGAKDLILGGNLSVMPARFGKATGSFGLLLRNDGKGKFQEIRNSESGLCVRGDVRKILNIDNRIFFAINSGPLTTYQTR